jgi:hypothetical protein
MKKNKNKKITTKEHDTIDEFSGEIVSNIEIESMSITSNVLSEDDITKPLNEYQAIPRPFWENKVITEESNFTLTLKNEGPSMNLGNVGYAYENVEGDIITNIPKLEFENHIPFIRSLLRKRK